MKWVKNLALSPPKRKECESRSRKAFLFSPKTKKQKELKITRWLENAEWTEEWRYEYPNLALSTNELESQFSMGRWHGLKWLDIEETIFQIIRDLGAEDA